MVAVANLWLFFYTPSRLIDKSPRSSGCPATTGSATRHGDACLAVMTVWKEAGFFMIFYLAALLSLSPELEEAAKIEGASRWYYFRRVTFRSSCHDPLRAGERDHQLVQVVDHLFILTKGGPDNASNLLLLHLPGGVQLLRDVLCSTLTVVLLAMLAAWRSCSSSDREAGALR